MTTGLIDLFKAGYELGKKTEKPVPPKAIVVLVNAFLSEYPESVCRCPVCRTYYVHVSKRRKTCCSNLCAAKMGNRKRKAVG